MGTHKLYRNQAVHKTADAKPATPPRHSREIREDGWTNLLTGLGSRVDKTKGSVSLFDRIISDEELEATYLDDGLGTNIVNMLPEDMFREGWDYTFPDLEELKAKNISETYETIMESIEASEKLEEGIEWARLYGAAIVLIGAFDGGDLERPLRPANIRAFEYLRIIDRTDISFNKIEFQLDPLKPRYGLPEYYPVSFKRSKTGLADVKRVHHSRVIEIHGERVPAGATKTLTEEQRYWGVSVLQRVYRRLEILGTSIGSMGALLNEISIGKYKFKDLAGILEMPNGDRLIKKRVELMDLCKSVFRSLYFDTDEDYIRETLQLGGVDAVLYIIMMLVSADTGYPITRLFGVSPAGMNATGESDMRNYYDKVRSRQQRVLKPILLRVVQIISEWQKLPEPFIEFRPLKQMSEKEQAELEKLQADKDQAVANTYKTYIDMGAMEPYEARYLQFGDSLDRIPVPEEEALPPVETAPEEEGGQEENNAGKEGVEGEDETEGDEGKSQGSDGSTPDGEGDGSGKQEDGPGDTGSGEDGGADDSGDIETRIAELEEKKDLTAEEKKELAELKKQIEGEKRKGKK
jgi:phage-related protein (TIGR01555 family)